MVAAYIFWLFYTLATAIQERDELDDPRGPCGPCFVDASAVSILYWVTETITFADYAPVTSTITFADTNITQEAIYSFVACNATSVQLDTAVVKSAALDDLNFQRDAFTTVVGSNVFYVVSSSVEIGTRTDTISATGALLASPTAYFAFTSVDVYPEAEGSRGADGTVTCKPRTKVPVLIETPIFVSGPSQNYGTVTSYGPEPLPTALVQYLQGDAALLQQYSQLSSCGAGLVQGAPVALVPITAPAKVSSSTSCSFTISPNGTSNGGPKQTKATGNLLVPGITGAYVAPTQRRFADQNGISTPNPIPNPVPVPVPVPVPQNPPSEVPNPQSEPEPIPAIPVVNTPPEQPPQQPPPGNEQSGTDSNPPGSEIPQAPPANPDIPPAAGADGSAEGNTVVNGGTQVDIPAGASVVADNSSPITPISPSETVPGAVVPADGLGAGDVGSSITLTLPSETVTGGAEGPGATGVGSSITLTLPSETVTGVVVSSDGSVVVLSIPTDGTNPPAPPIEFSGTASKEKRVLGSLVVGLAFLIGVFGRL